MEHANHAAHFMDRVLDPLAACLNREAALSILDLRIGDNSVSVHHYCFPWGTIRCQFIIIASLGGQFGVSSSLLLPLGDNSVSVHHYCFPCIKSVSWIQGTIRCQFIIIASLGGTIRCQFVRQFGVSSSLLLPLCIRDNSVSVHHYCFPCIKSVSWIHGTIRCQFIIIASLASSR